MSDRKIVVAGDVMLDMYTRVKTLGVSKENTAVMVAREESRDFNLGGAANVARCVKALGGDPVLYGFNSDKRVEHLTAQDRICHHFVRPKYGHTPVKNRIVTRDGHYLLRLDEEAPFFGQPDEWWAAGGEHVGRGIEALLFNGIDNPKPVICLVDYDKGFLTEAAAKCIMYHVNAVHESVPFPIIVDPGRHGLWHKFGSRRTIFRANLFQAMQLYHQVRAKTGGGMPPYPSDVDPGEVHDDRTYETAAYATSQNLIDAKVEFAYVVLTLGPGGLAVVAPPKHGVRNIAIVPAAKEKVTDTCGAGDVVTATMAVILASEDDPLSWPAVTASVQTALRAASIAVRMPGVYAVTREDMGWFTTTGSTPTPQPTSTG